MRADSGSGQARRGFPLRLCASARVPALVWPKPILAPASLKTQRRQDRKNPSPRLVEGFNDTVLDPERAIHRQVWASEWRQANDASVDLGQQPIRLPPFACPKARPPSGTLRSQDRRLYLEKIGGQADSGCLGLKIFMPTSVWHGNAERAENAEDETPLRELRVLRVSNPSGASLHRQVWANALSEAGAPRCA